MSIVIELDAVPDSQELLGKIAPIFTVPDDSTVELKVHLAHRFVIPEHLLMLAASVNSLRARGVNITGSLKCNRTIAGYVSRMDFFKNVKIQYPETFVRRDPDNRFIELTNFSSDDDYIMVDRVIEMLRSNTGIPDSVLTTLSFCLGEVIGNIHFHAESTTGGWIVAQYYPNRNYINITVGDTGIGIHSALTQNPQYSSWTEVRTVSECINNRITNGNGRGFGLYATANFVKLVNGEMNIYSGNSFLNLKKFSKLVSPSNNWQGTIVNLRINTDNAIDPLKATDGYSAFINDYRERYEEGGLSQLW